MESSVYRRCFHFFVATSTTQSSYCFSVHWYSAYANRLESGDQHGGVASTSLWCVSCRASVPSGLMTKTLCKPPLSRVPSEKAIHRPSGDHRGLWPVGRICCVSLPSGLMVKIPLGHPGTCSPVRSNVIREDAARFPDPPNQLLNIIGLLIGRYHSVTAN